MFKKVFTIAVVFATVCWSMGLAAVMPAFAATISAGDLIKASGAAVYYYGADGMRYTFPTQDVYMSWYEDFSAVKTITDAELAAIDMGGNATIRPGTKLVKITTDPKTYAVEMGGVLRHIESEAAALALYGADWASMIVDVDDTLWFNYQRTGSALDGSANSNGSLVKYVGSDTIYLIEDGMKRAVSSDAFAANMFQTMNVLTISDTITYSDGTGLTGEESDITNVAGGASAVVPVGGGLTVALAADTPASGIVVGGAARVPFTKINLTAGGGDVTVDHVIVQRTGLGNDNAFSSLDLIDAATGLPINTTSKSLNSTHQATFTKDFTVPAGTTRSLIVAGNMASSLTNYAGEVPSLTVVEVSTNGSVSGSLPIAGNYQTLNGTISIGSATVSRGAYTNATSTSIEVGKTGYTFGSFQVAAGSAEAVSFSQVKVYQGGSASLGDDLSNVMLYRDGTKLADGVTDGKYVSFTFGEVVLDKGETGQFLIKADVTDGSARTIDLGIYKTTDLTVMGQTYGYNITPTYSGTGSSATSPVLSENQFTISNGTLTVSKSNTVGATDITIADDQIIGAFNFTVKGEPIDITQVVMTVSSTTVDSTGLTNLEIIDANGNTLAGPGDPTNGSVTFSDSFTAPVGENVYRVRGDLETNGGWVTNETLYATLSGSNITAEGTVTGQSITPSGTSINTNTQTVKAGKLTVTRDTLPATGNIITGSDNVELGSWTFDANDSGEDIRITAISLAASSSAATNLTLYADGVAMDPVNDKPSSTDDGATSTFALSEPLIITKGTQVTIMLKGDIESSAVATDSSQFGITTNAAVTAYGRTTGNSVTPTVTADNGAVLTYLASGTLTISTSSNPPAGIVIAGSTGNTMTKVRLKAKNEDLDLNTLKVFVTDGGVSSATGNYQDIVAVSVYDGSTMIASHSIPSTGLYEFTFATGTVTIPEGGEKVLTVKADFSTIDADTDNAPGTASADVKIGLGGASGIKTTGTSSNTEITGSSETYQGSTSSAMVLHKSQPTVTYSTSVDPMGAATQLTAGSLALFKFKVAADANNEVLLYSVNFDITTTTGVDITAMSIKDQDGNTVSVATNATFVAGAGTYTTTFNNPDISAGDAKEALEVPAGTTRTYTVYGTVSGASTGDYVSMTMTADTGHTLGTGDATNTARNFVWSDNVKDDGLDTDGDNATTSSQWLGGLYVSGLTSPSAYVVGYSS